MDKYEVRTGVPGDEEEMARIDLECFPEEPWSVEMFRHDLAENPFALYILAEDPAAPEGEKIMGYAGIYLIAGEGHITNVAVRPKYRGQGLGNDLMKLLDMHCRMAEITSMTLEVRPSNETAIKLYERNGFHTEGRRKRYYENNGEDALIMWKFLDSAASEKKTAPVSRQGANGQGTDSQGSDSQGANGQGTDSQSADSQGADGSSEEDSSKE